MSVNRFKDGTLEKYDSSSGFSQEYIADDLVTDTATKVLSARQGKILNEKIGNIDTLLDTINGEVV